MKRKLIIGLMALGLLAFIIPSILPPPGRNGSSSTESTYKRSSGTKSQNEEPKFVKEGTLSIMSSGDEKATIDIEIADTDKRRMQGLKFRTSMKENQGMLFLFDKMSIQSFWMKDTYIPLDILFIDADNKIIDITQNVTATTDVAGKPQTVTSTSEAKYVLEVNKGFVQGYGIVIGDEINWSRQ